jgi:hypothetical protein
VDNNYLDLGMNKSGFVHTFPSGRLRPIPLELHALRSVSVSVEFYGGETPLTSNETISLYDLIYRHISTI